MSKAQTLKALDDRCFAARITITDLCEQAGVSPATVSRWRKNPETMTPRTVSKLEAKLKEIEAV